MHRKIICLGDSLTEGKDLEIGYRWSSLVSNATGLNVVNKGIGGDSTSGMLARVYTDVLAEKPDFVLIMGGTNDLWWEIPPNITLANLFSIVYQTQYHGMTPILSTPLPIIIEKVEKQNFGPPECGFEKFSNNLSHFVNYLKKHAMQNEIAIVDVYQAFMDHAMPVNAELFLEDGLHPNNKGHRLIAENIISTLKTVFLF